MSFVVILILATADITLCLVSSMGHRSRVSRLCLILTKVWDKMINQDRIQKL